MSVILIIVGGALTYYSWWLLLRASDGRVNRNVRFFRTPGMSKEDAAAGREMESAMLAVVLMVMGSVLLIAGIAKLFRLTGD